MVQFGECSTQLGAIRVLRLNKRREKRSVVKTKVASNSSATRSDYVDQRSSLIKLRGPASSSEAK